MAGRAQACSRQWAGGDSYWRMLSTERFGWLCTRHLRAERARLVSVLDCRKFQDRHGVVERARHTTALARPPGPTVAFVGLGAMGYQMAMRLATQPFRPESPAEHEQVRGARLHRGTDLHRGMREQVMRNVLVWNRTKATAARHSDDFNTQDISHEPFSAANVGSASVVFLCLPTSDITFDVIKDMASHLTPDCVVVDCCTGDPSISLQIAAWLREVRPGLRYMDCPVSGGPGGATKGTLAAFLGGESDLLEVVLPHVKAFAKKPVHLGPVGSGHAVKAINNACNVSNLLCLHEGLLALKCMGVDPSRALEVINSSSGRSLMSQARVPEEVLTGEFNYGFKLGLMAKDVGIANRILDQYFPRGQVYRHTLKVHFDAMAAGEVSFDADYTEIVKHQEKQAGVRLRPEDPVLPDGGPSSPQTVEALDAQVQKLAAENANLRARLEAAQAPAT